MTSRRPVQGEPSKLPFFDSEITQAEYPLRVPAMPDNPIDLDTSDVERAERFKKLYGGCISDALHLNGIVNTVVDHAIRSLRGHDVLAGRAIPVKWHSLAPEVHITQRQYEQRKAEWDRAGTPQKRMHAAIREGTVLVFDNGGDTQAALFGEMSCTLARSRGCIGVVNSGMTRDSRLILQMDSFPYFTRGTTPNSYGGWRIIGVNEPIYLPGHLTHYVIVNPGDFVFGDDDGLQIIPRDYVDSVLVKAEEIFAFEQKERKLIRDGMPIDQVYDSFGDL